MASISYGRLTEDKIDDMIGVLALSREGLPYERRLTRGEAMALTLLDPDFDPRGSWLVYLGGKAVGFGSASVDSNRLRAGKDDGHMDFDVVPQYRNLGMEQELLLKGLAYLRSRGIGTALVRCNEVDEWKITLLRSNSFLEFYKVFDLVRRGGSVAPRLSVPEGYILEHRLFKDYSDDQLAAVVGAFNDSFLDHMNFAPEKPERFINWRDGASDPMLITTVSLGKEIVGVCLTEESALYNKEHGTRIGWVNILGVVPKCRRMGLARAMLADGIAWLLNRGVDTIYIGVVSENEKALDLYRSLGFEKENEGIWFRLPLAVESADVTGH